MTLVWTDKESADIVSMYNYFVLFFTCWCLLWLLNKIQWDTTNYLLKVLFLCYWMGYLYSPYFLEVPVPYLSYLPLRKPNVTLQESNVLMHAQSVFLCVINPVFYFVVYIATYVSNSKFNIFFRFLCISTVLLWL